MASSSTLKMLGMAAQAGGSYYGQIHAESMRTKRAQEAKDAAAALREQTKLDAIVKRDEQRLFEAEKEKQKRKRAAAALTEQRAFNKKNEKPSVLQEKIDLAETDPDLYRKMFPKGAAKRSVLQEKIDLAETDPDLYRKMFPKGREGESLADSTKRLEIESRVTSAIKSNDRFVENGLSARGDYRRYSRILSLLENVDTGTFEETIVDMKKASDALGMDIDMSNIASAEELMVLLGNEVMSRISETKGSVSEKEMELFQVYSAGFGKTVKGNRQIIRFKQALSKRNIELGKMVSKLRRADKPSRDIQEAAYAFINAPENDLSNYLVIEDSEAPPEIAPKKTRQTRAQRLAKIRENNAGR
jgi:hypothetical protein